ncbi:hypothetical protein DH2020_012363 [Rehmannia glutinosa]|uniref:Cyclin-dependent kinase inhibitor n=1 Tax=Rehmannia glutinosa TaxID=99300 RepID=A0ABR0WZX2_REHGL
MVRYLRNCKEAMEKEAQVAAATGRKRKVSLGESQLSTSSVQLKTRRLSVATPENSASPASSGNSTCETDGPDHVLASCCSSNGSSELAEGSSKFVDLEDEVNVEFFATSAGGDSLDCTERRGTTPLDEAQAESGELESTARPRESNSRRSSTAEKMPSDAELEEFFAAAEKDLQKQFIDKYNYDIVKDQPLEGRYDWVKVQLKP